MGSSSWSKFCITKPKGLISIILADAYLSTPIWIKDAKRLIKLLPIKTQKIIAQFEKDQIITKEYKVAALEFYQNFTRRYKRTPSPSLKSRAGKNQEIYEFMWGPEEFIVSGTLKDFDLSSRLSAITIPVLLVCGRFDEATPEAMNYFAKLFPNSKIKILENSAHNPQLTEKIKYIKIIRDFLNMPACTFRHAGWHRALLLLPLR